MFWHLNKVEETCYWGKMALMEEREILCNDGVEKIQNLKKGL